MLTFKIRKKITLIKKLYFSLQKFTFSKNFFVIFKKFRKFYNITFLVFELLTTGISNKLQVILIKDILALLNMNWKDDKIYLSPIKAKTLIKNPLAIKNYNRWKSLHKGEEYRLDQAAKRVCKKKFKKIFY